MQDGATLWSSRTVVRYADALPFAVAVDAGDVTLLVDSLGSIDCDAAVWADLRVE